MKNLKKYKNTQSYILGCKKGCKSRKCLIYTLYCGEKGSLCIAFKDGADWCINSVWHDASEQPKRNEIYLVQMGKDGFDTFYDSKNWKVFKRGLNITRWAYIEDLLPNTEE